MFLIILGLMRMIHAPYVRTLVGRTYAGGPCDIPPYTCTGELGDIPPYTCTRQLGNIPPYTCTRELGDILPYSAL